MIVNRYHQKSNDVIYTCIYIYIYIHIHMCVYIYINHKYINNIYIIYYIYTIYIIYNIYICIYIFRRQPWSDETKNGRRFRSVSAIVIVLGWIGRHGVGHLHSTTCQRHVGEADKKRDLPLVICCSKIMSNLINVQTWGDTNWSNGFSLVDTDDRRWTGQLLASSDAGWGCSWVQAWHFESFWSP